MLLFSADLGACVTGHDNSALQGYCWCPGYWNRFRCGNMITCIWMYTFHFTNNQLNFHINTFTDELPTVAEQRTIKQRNKIIQNIQVDIPSNSCLVHRVHSSQSCRIVVWSCSMPMSQACCCYLRQRNETYICVCVSCNPCKCIRGKNCRKFLCIPFMTLYYNWQSVVQLWGSVSCLYFHYFWGYCKMNTY
jgi:hypothetical protein